MARFIALTSSTSIGGPPIAFRVNVDHIVTYWPQDDGCTLRMSTDRRLLCAETAAMVDELILSLGARD